MPKAKIYDSQDGSQRLVAIHCPGCNIKHFFTVKSKENDAWTWNGSLESPTFSPSMLTNRTDTTRCHSYVTNGKIEFLSDCMHDLKNQTVDIPEWNDNTTNEP